MLLSIYWIIWVGVFDYFVCSGLKGLIYMHMHVCFHVCSVLSCYVWMFCLFIVCIYMYMHLMYICMCVYIYVHLCTYMLVSMYVLVHAFICIKVIYLFVLLGCDFLVWYCYLGSILAFSFEFQNFNTTICTKTL